MHAISHMNDFTTVKKSKVVKIGGRINPTDPITLGSNNRQQIDLIDL